MKEMLRPAAEWELQGMLADCVERRVPIEVMGNGSKRGVGRPVQAGATLSTGALKGLPLYEPSELVMSARTGTPLADVEAKLAGNGQMLAFEPIDLGPALGEPPAAQTIGAVFAANLSGARRILAGAARDNLIGIRAVNGRAELFKSGGRVMKNVTGYDLARGLAGSWGTLGVLTEVTFKVVPQPEETGTLVYLGLTDELAAELMCAAMGTPYEVSGAVHLPLNLARRLGEAGLATADKPLTALRIENFSTSVGYRRAALREALKPFGFIEAVDLDHEQSLQLWGALRQLAMFSFSVAPLWRISTAPRKGPELVAAIKRHMATAEAFYDWSGGLVWLEVPPSADAGAADIRRAVAVHGGHATLVRAEPAVRAVVEVFQPLTPAIERLTRGLKSAFDPAGLLNPGRMYAHI